QRGHGSESERSHEIERGKPAHHPGGRGRGPGTKAGVRISGASVHGAARVERDGRAQGRAAVSRGDRPAGDRSAASRYVGHGPGGTGSKVPPRNQSALYDWV